MSRKHIHLSSDRKTAEDVDRRHGKPIVLEIDTEALYNSGINFIYHETMCGYVIVKA